MKAKAALEKLSKMDPRLAKMINDLKDSGHDVNVLLDVMDSKAGYAGNAQTHAGNMKQYLDSANGKGNGVTVHSWGADPYVAGDGYERNKYVVLAHELQHALDHVNGNVSAVLGTRRDGTQKWIDFAPEHEYRAVRTENIVRQAMGQPLRTTYGGAAVPNYGPQFSPLSN